MTDVTPPEPSQPSNVIAALARVMAEMPAVGKDAQYSGGGSGSYSYRSIEAVTAAAQKLLGKYGAVPVPRVITRKTIEITVAGKPWTQDELEIIYRFYGPGGLEDFVDVGPVWGLGRDNSDKGTNKAATQAYKVALIQLLCIGDSGHDGDSERAETDSRPQVPVDPDAWFKENGWQTRSEHDEWRKALAARLAAVPDEVKLAFRAWWADQGVEWKAPWPHALSEAVAKRLAALADDHQSPESPTEPAPLSAAEAESVGNALVEHLKSLDRVALAGEFAKRGDKVVEAWTDEKMRQKLGLKMLAEGWRPAQPSLLGAADLCAWCGIAGSETSELEEFGAAGMMHPACFSEHEEDKASADPGRPF